MADERERLSVSLSPVSAERLEQIIAVRGGSASKRQIVEEAVNRLYLWDPLIAAFCRSSSDRTGPGSVVDWGAGTLSSCLLDKS